MFFRAVIFCLLLAAPLQAGLTGESRVVLPMKIYNIAEPYGGRVGLTFLEPKTGWTFSINGSSEFPAASVAKVPVMAAAYHLADLGELNLSQKIIFRESDKLGGSGVLQWIRGGKTYTLRNLIRLMIVLSDNTATRLVVNNVGRKEINSYCKSLGLDGTAINDPTMLVEPPAANNNRTTPLDMARLMQIIQKREDFSPGSANEMIGFMRQQKYRWGLWRGVPPGTTIANKTGNLQGILNDVGIVYTKKGSYILAVFTRGFKKKSEARKLINLLSRVAYEEFTGEKVIEPKKAPARKKAISKRRSRHRPSVKSRQRSGRRGAASGHRSRTSPRR